MGTEKSVSRAQGSMLACTFACRQFIGLHFIDQGSLANGAFTGTRDNRGAAFRTSQSHLYRISSAFITM